jgi:hypothetical protein
MPAQIPRGTGGPANASYDHKVTLWYFTLERRAIGFRMIFSAFGNFFVGKLPRHPFVGDCVLASRNGLKIWCIIEVQMNQQGPNNLSQPTHVVDRGRSAMARVFLGDDGLRSGWRLFLYIIAVMLLESIFLTLMRKFLGHGSQVETPGRSIIGEALLLIAAVVPALVAARLEHRPWGTYGLPSRKGEAQKLVTGLVVGFIALSAILLLIHFFHSFYLGPIILPGAQLVRFAVEWAVAFLLVGVTEEFLFRGYSLHTLARGIGFWPAAVLLSTFFGAIHLRNIGEDWIGALGTIAIALVFAFSLWRTGSLWFAVGLHASWDWAESFFYGVPDSGYQAAGTLFTPRFAGSKWITGGSVGPEGSVLAFVIVIAMALTIHLLYPKRQWQRD